MSHAEGGGCVRMEITGWILEQSWRYNKKILGG